MILNILKKEKKFVWIILLLINRNKSVFMEMFISVDERALNFKFF